MFFFSQFSLSLSDSLVALSRTNSILNSWQQLSTWNPLTLDFLPDLSGLSPKTPKRYLPNCWATLRAFPCYTVVPRYPITDMHRGKINIFIDMLCTMAKSSIQEQEFTFPVKFIGSIQEVHIQSTFQPCNNTTNDGHHIQGNPSCTFRDFTHFLLQSIQL